MHIVAPLKWPHGRKGILLRRTMFQFAQSDSSNAPFGSAGRESRVASRERRKSLPLLDIRTPGPPRCDSSNSSNCFQSRVGRTPLEAFSALRLRFHRVCLGTVESTSENRCCTRFHVGIDTRFRLVLKSRSWRAARTDAGSATAPFGERKCFAPCRMHRPSPRCITRIPRRHRRSFPSASRIGTAGRCCALACCRCSNKSRAWPSR